MATPIDIHGMADWNLSAEDFLFWANCSDSNPDLTRLLAEFNGKDFSKSFVLKIDQITVAYGEIWIEDQEVELARLLVNPKHRKSGLGTFLVRSLVEEAKKLNRAIWLRVHPSNRQAIRVYEKIGFFRATKEQQSNFNTGSSVSFVWMGIS